MSEHGHSFHIDTSLSTELIGQVISRDVYGMRTEVWRQIINLQDEEIRQGLIKLGWTPPGQPAAPQMSDAMVDLHLDAVLRASGSALRNYSMQQTIDRMRAAMRAALEAALAQPGEEG